MHCQALHKMYVSVSIHNQTELNQSSKSPARKLTHITITQRSRACSAPNTQTPRPPTTTQPRLFCAEHPAATPQQPQQLTAHITRNHHPNTPIPPGVAAKHAANCPKEHSNRKTQHPELFCAEHLTAVTPITSPKQQFLPKLFIGIRDTLMAGCLLMRPTVLRRTP